jgi:hypothetical protein
VLTDFDNTLKQLLITRIPLDPDEVDVSFECPRREWSAKVLRPTVNLYLFDLRENDELRDGGWAPQRGRGDGPSGRRRSPVYVDLSYFITAWARNVADEHHLLWRVMTTLMREPAIEADVLEGVMRDLGAPIKTRTARADGVLRNPGEFWGALANDLRPAVTYTATLAVDLDVLRDAPLVLTRIVDVGDTARRRRDRLVEIGGAVRTRASGAAPARPAAGAEVAFPRLGIAVQCDDEGRYAVSRLPEGTHDVRVTSALGAVADATLTVPSPAYDLEV